MSHTILEHMLLHLHAQIDINDLGRELQYFENNAPRGGQYCSSQDRLTEIMSWLKQPVLVDWSVDEIIQARILQHQNKGLYEYIARNKDGMVCLFGRQPNKNTEDWFSPTINYITLPQHIGAIFSHVRWEDDFATRLSDIKEMPIK